MNQKRIGNSYERQMSRKLSVWMTGSDKELVVWRNTGSGNVATIAARKGINASRVGGDFQCLKSEYEPFFSMFHCDSKSLSNLNIYIPNPKNIQSNVLLKEYLDVCAQAGDKKVLMFVKDRKNRCLPEFVVVDPRIKVPQTYSLQYISYLFRYKGDTHSFTLLTQDEFFNKIKYQELIDANIEKNT